MASRSLFIALMLLGALLPVFVKAQGMGMMDRGTIFAVEQSMTDKSFYLVNSSATDPSLIMVANMSMLEQDQPLEFPMNCYGYQSGLNPNRNALNLFAPNALAWDGQVRLFFVAWDMTGDVAARMCYLNLVGRNIIFTVTLPDVKISNADFDQEKYVFVYGREGIQQPVGTLTMMFVFLNRATAMVSSIRPISQFRNGSPQAPLAPLSVTYRAGDIAIDCSGDIYMSSVGTGNGFKAFFVLRMVTTMLDYYYELIHEDPMGVALTGYATAQAGLGFAQSGVLISQNGDYGIFSQVNLATGANGELGTAGVDYVQFYYNGQLRRFTDLAGALDCNADLLCIRTEVPSPCGGGFNSVLMPSEEGDIPCGPVERLCLQPPQCVEEVGCVVYEEIEGLSFGGFSLF